MSHMPLFALLKTSMQTFCFVFPQGWEVGAKIFSGVFPRDFWPPTHPAVKEKKANLMALRARSRHPQLTTCTLCRVMTV